MTHPSISNVYRAALRLSSFGLTLAGILFFSPLTAHAETKLEEEELWEEFPGQPVQQSSAEELVGDSTEEMDWISDSVAQASDLENHAEVFGQKGQKRWYVQGAGASTWTGSPARRFGLLGAGASRFFADGHSVNLELNGMAFDQNGGDAAGLNFSTILRWHFLRQENWSMYLDGGAGVLVTTNEVPAAGSSFNFTPQAGGGVTVRLTERQRLMLGIRWHHISNANTFDSNPGRDSIMGYVGLNLPR